MGGSGGNSNPAPAAGAAQGHPVAGDSIVLEEEIDPNYVPTQDEVREYAKWLGMELEDDRDLFWIAKEGLKAPLPENWKPCKTVDTDEIYYFNFATGESTWDHPCDEYYRKLYEEEKKKKLTKDKAKHDKSKQQAKKDVNQLLGRNKRKSRPARKRSTHPPSPERIEAVPSPASAIFDRKPLPGIGRQPLQRGDVLDYQALASSASQAETAEPLPDRSPARTHRHSLVGHRLSQHLSVSVESEEGHQKSEDQEACEDVNKPCSPSRRQPRSRGEDDRARDTTSEMISANSKHAAARKELSAKHAQELAVLEEAHNDTKRQLEDNHRSQLVSQKRQWSVTAEAQTDDARKMLKSELDKTRADHSREIDTLERNLIDAKVRLEKAKDETEEAREAAMKEKRELELALNTLRREVLEEKGFLEEAREAAQKVQVAEAIQADGRLRVELARLVSELEDERKYVTELENQLKEADNGADLPSSALRAVGSDPSGGLNPEGEQSTDANLAVLEKRLDFVLPGDGELRKKEAPGADFVASGSGGRTAASEGEANKHSRDQEYNELADFKRALKEAGAKLADLQETKYRVEQDAKNTAVALVEIQKKAASLEFDNNRLADQMARDRQRAVSEGEASSMTLVDLEKAEAKHTHARLELEEALAGMRITIAEYEADAAVRRQEIEELRAGLEASRNEIKRYTSDGQRSKQREESVRKELHAAQLVVHEGQLQVAGLEGTLAAAEHENTLHTALVEQLRMDGARLKEELEGMRASAGGNKSREGADTLLDELKGLKMQLESSSNERNQLNAKIAALKHKLVSSDGVLQAERATFEAHNASQQRHVGSLQLAVQKLEAEVSAGKRRDEALHTAAKTLREHKTALDLEAVRFKEGRLEATLEAGRLTSDLGPTKQVKKHKDDGSEEDMVSTAELEKEKKNADAAIREGRAIAAENNSMSSSLRCAEEQIGRLQATLQDTVSKLTDAESAAASVQLSAQGTASQMVAEEELASVRRAKQDATEGLIAFRTQLTDVEERLAQACQQRATLERTLHEVVAIRDDQARELRDTQDSLSALLEKGYRNAGSQTAVNEQIFTLEQKLAQLQEKLHVANADLASSRHKAVELRQELANLTTRANQATSEARRNEELASARREEIMSCSEREQRLRVELDQARSDIEVAIKRRESSLAAAEEGKHCLVDAGSVLRRDKDGLRVPLEDASVGAGDHEEAKAPSLKGVFATKPQQPLPSSVLRVSAEQEPDVIEEGIATMANEVPHRSIGDTSDTTSHGMVDELMQKLTEETTQRRNARQATREKASRSWKKKLDAERRMLALAKQVVKYHKERVKQRQQHLLLCQNRWRDQWQLCRSSAPNDARLRHSVRHRSLEKAKLELDSEVHDLNKIVKRLRFSKTWLGKREKKISDFEALLEAGACCSEPKPEQDTSSAPTSDAPHFSPESSSATRKLCSLEVMLQELENDVPEFTVDSSTGGAYFPPNARNSNWDGARDSSRYTARGEANRNESRRGKENARPVFPPPCSMGYPPNVAVPVGPRLSARQRHPYLAESRTSQEGFHSGSRTRHKQRRRQDQSRYGDGGQYPPTDNFTANDERGSSELDLQLWLNRPELNPGHTESGAATRERTGHIAKLTVEGIQAQSTVAMHVDWLNTLRQEMGLFGLYAGTSTRPRAPAEAVSGLSGAVNAVTSPHRVGKAGTMGSQPYRDI